MTSSSEYYIFGPHKIHRELIFYTTNLSYVMVNLRPVCPGHVLVIPKREVKRFVDLNPQEICDLWLTAQLIGAKLELFHKASSLTFNLQDGPEAGQTVPHVHIHIIPRKEGDFKRNDDIYDAVNENDRALHQHIDLDEKRPDRGFEEMKQEADEYTKLFF
ncbi:bifunctional bis(5'-adenosyl)-triphosphatase/adenylylsulfatase FHIT-like [Benincasa hispida]|uniref:bifunctional bis(5'-adenosyl)-triphosphatase/adenylylsulfatase FHIT-like n=1 Tax=Benincasa hispida TaxID=102211 RepID=UPI001901D2BA|nr:bifunctional bis(5'-adenosyl)-triphosphatase/adenylylsulfatase FHIT-like [Benincasa hispida]XP_038903516.1 bifunctional bis(5'-adenosyl)-triphosphatase/adenylylsulfatase FHIT-like [Benincasa hispida]